MELKQQALSLYKEVFCEDGIDFANTFTEKYFENCCRYILVEGKIASMLYLLDCTVFDGENTYSAKYLYAAATHPEYRGQGLMSSLINKVLAEENIIIIKPATKELFKFYEKFGFKVCSFKDEVKKEFSNQVGIADYIETRKILLKNIPHIILSDEEFALQGLKLYSDGTFCAAIDDETKIVKEYIGENLFNGTNPFAMWTLKSKAPVYFTLRQLYGAP